MGAHCLHLLERLKRSSANAATDDLEEDGVNLAAPKRRKRTWEEASDDEAADPEAVEAARKEAEMEADRSGHQLTSAMGPI